MALEILLGENSTITRLAAPVALHAAQLLQPPFDASLPQRILDDSAQGLALGLGERLGIASELCGKGDRFLDCGSHGRRCRVGNCDGMNKSYRRLDCLSKARATRARNDRSRRSPCVPRL